MKDAVHELCTLVLMFECSHQFVLLTSVCMNVPEIASCFHFMTKGGSTSTQIQFPIDLPRSPRLQVTVYFANSERIHATPAVAAAVPSYLPGGKAVQGCDRRWYLCTSLERAKFA